MAISHHRYPLKELCLLQCSAPTSYSKQNLEGTKSCLIHRTSLFEYTYLGKTVTKAHVRAIGNRKCLKVNNTEAIGKSALFQHCEDKYPKQS